MSNPFEHSTEFANNPPRETPAHDKNQAQQFGEEMAKVAHLAPAESEKVAARFQFKAVKFMKDPKQRSGLRFADGSKLFWNEARTKLVYELKA